MLMWPPKEEGLHSRSLKRTPGSDWGRRGTAFWVWGPSASREENWEREQQRLSLISQSAKLKIKHLTQMASNYRDLSRQLERRVQTFILFFLPLCFLTDNRSERERELHSFTRRRGETLRRLRTGKHPRLPVWLLACARAAPCR